MSRRGSGNSEVVSNTLKDIKDWRTRKAISSAEIRWVELDQTPNVLAFAAKKFGELQHFKVQPSMMW